MIKLSNSKSKIRKALWLLCAIYIVWVLHCKIEIVGGVDNGSRILYYISRLSVSFTTYNLVDIIILVGVYLLIRHVVLYDESYDIWSAVLSVAFSVCYILSLSYSAFNSAEFLFANHYQMFFSGICIIGYSLFFYFVLRLLLIYIEEYMKKPVPVKMDTFIYKHFWLSGFLIILVGWLPWILMNYPGSPQIDSTNQLMQYFGDADFTAHHPPLSTYIMGGLMVLGNFIIDVNFGFFLYLLLQTCLGALILSYGLKKLYIMGVQFRYCFIGILFFALTPIFGLFAQWYEKSLLYTEWITLFLIYLEDIVRTRECSKKDAAMLIMAGIISSLLRNNGIYVVLPTVFLLIFYLKETSRKRMWFVFINIILIFGIVTQILYSSVLGITEGSIREALNIPFQQTARYVVEYGAEVTEYEREVINEVLDYGALSESYEPGRSDPVKATYKEDASKLPEYFKVWFQMFRKHPGVYMSAFLNGANGYIAPVGKSSGGSIVTEYEEKYSYLANMGLHRVFNEFPTGIFLYISNAGEDMPLIGYVHMPGMYTWIMMICIMILAKKRIYWALILFVPGIMNLLVCIASPVAGYMRYALPLATATPFLVGWTYYYIVCEKDMDNAV